MKEQEHVEELMQLLRMKLSEDKVKTVLVDITKLGLVEITRMKKKSTFAGGVVLGVKSKSKMYSAAKKKNLWR